MAVFTYTPVPALFFSVQLNERLSLCFMLDRLLDVVTLVHAMSRSVGVGSVTVMVLVALAPYPSAALQVMTAVPAAFAVT